MPERPDRAHRWALTAAHPQPNAAVRQSHGLDQTLTGLVLQLLEGGSRDADGQDSVWASSWSWSSRTTRNTTSRMQGYLSFRIHPWAAKISAGVAAGYGEPAQSATVKPGFALEGRMVEHQPSGTPHRNTPLQPGLRTLTSGTVSGWELWAWSSWIQTMKKVLIASGCVLALTSITPMEAAWAQRSSQVQFQPGNYGTMVSGTITGREYIDYKLTARKGQKMFAELTVSGTNGNGSVYFNILPPGSTGQAIHTGHMETRKSALVNLPTSGTYTIRVYLMGNDKDAGKTVGFNLDLSIQ